MNSAAGLGEITVGMLRATFPAWRVFEHVGAWWAVRPGIEKFDGPESLRVRAVTAPDLTSLAERLCLQDWLDGLEDDELERVYRGDVAESAPCSNG
jgi:hypothetical protein